MFDPYRKWLGIPAKDQPPNHYRLLGLELFESDPDVIDGAADRQMGFVRQYQSGEHAAEAAKILNELAIARLCLLKPASKSVYDAKLQNELAPPPELSLPAFSEAPRKKRKKLGKTRSSGPSQQLVIAGGIGVVACVLLVVFLNSGRRHSSIEKTNDVASETPIVQTTKPGTETATIPPTTSVAWTDSKLVTEPAGPPVDLLKLIDLQRDVVGGEWKPSNSALSGSRHGRIYLPVKTPEDYQLKITARPLEATDTLMLGFMMSGRQGMVAIDSGFGATSGLYVDGRDSTDNCTTWRGKTFADQSPVTIVLTVHPGHLHVACGDKEIVNWHGNPERLYLHPDHGIACRESPFLATYDCQYIIESASLIPIKPTPVPPRLTRLDREVDVLPLFDLDRDADRGIWSIQKNMLYSPAQTGRLYLPTVVPEEYTLTSTVEPARDLKGVFALTVGMRAGKSSFQFVAGDGDTGLDLIDGRRWYGNEARFRGCVLKPGVPVKLTCTVTKNAIRVEVDGRTVIDWRGDVRRLSLPAEWTPADGRRLFFGATHHFKFRDIRLGPPVSRPKYSDHPPVPLGKSLDLMTVIDPVRDALGGTWERDGKSLLCKGDTEWNKLAIPFEVPDEYKITLRVARLETGREKNETILVRAPFGRSAAVVGIDVKASAFSGLYVEGDIPQNEFCYREGPVIPLGVTREIVIAVQKNRLQVTSDGKTIIDRTCPDERCWGPDELVVPGRWLSLASWNQGVRFEKLVLEPLPPTTIATVPSIEVDGKVLPIIDVARDARQADWKLDGDGLHSPNVRSASLRIPAKVPLRYKFSVNVERKHGDNELFLGLLVGSHYCWMALDAQHSRQAGINLLDGKTYGDRVNLTNRKYPAPLFPPNQRVQVHCYVLPDTIIVTCAEKEVIRWHGDPRRLADPESAHLRLGSLDSAFSYRELELRPLTDAEVEQLSKSFTGVFPTTSQSDVPLVKP